MLLPSRVLPGYRPPTTPVLSLPHGIRHSRSVSGHMTPISGHMIPASGHMTRVSGHMTPASSHMTQSHRSGCGSCDLSSTPQFWDVRQPTLAGQLQLPERAYCMDVMYPMAVVGTAARGLIIYTLEGSPSEYRVSFHLSFHLFLSEVTTVLSKQLKMFLSLFLSLCCCVEDRQSTEVPTSLCLHLQGETRSPHWFCSRLH